MSGPKRNPDKLNTIGVVVVGVCGAVLVYVTIVALQAFYMNDTSELQTMKDYGGQDITAKGHKSDEMRNITEAASNQGTTTFRIPIDVAMKLVVQDAQKDPSHLVPALPPSVKSTIQPVFGRPKTIETPAPAAPPPANQAGSGSTPAPMVPTGAPGQPQPVPGAGGAPKTQAPPAVPKKKAGAH